MLGLLRQAATLSPRAWTGIAEARGEPACSPLDGSPVLYCRWRVERRLLRRGIDDAITGEVSAPFRVRSATGEIRDIDLDEVILNLAPRAEHGWTAAEDGLCAGVRARVHAAFPDPAPGALYHLSQVILAPGSRVWLSRDERTLTDRAPDVVRRGALLAAGLRAAPAAALLATGVALW